eukprot:CAMPEP_0118868862 /NCGR_PEP_ID=MMETSP1163-20130328/12330_1 /TAXON_ID=124430 /ORGANISM="Phaeomonas parva, Strain CCMP2877" /LENGTH=607 /DNA_ID=CAMNT_0006803655 /DNA_START=268 /DNA_END=2091 /DNA_ORIENTATION=+
MRELESKQRQRKQPQQEQEQRRKQQAQQAVVSLPKSSTSPEEVLLGWLLASTPAALALVWLTNGNGSESSKTSKKQKKPMASQQDYPENDYVEVHSPLLAAADLLSATIDSAFNGTRKTPPRTGGMSAPIAPKPRSPRFAKAQKALKRATNIRSSACSSRNRSSFRRPSPGRGVELLPEDVLRGVLLFLDESDIKSVGLASRALRRVVKHPIVWAEQALRRVYPADGPLRQGWDDGEFHAVVSKVPARHWAYLRHICMIAQPMPAMPIEADAEAEAEDDEAEAEDDEAEDEAEHAALIQPQPVNRLPKGIDHLGYDTYQFADEVGVANRCIRAPEALPRPQMAAQERILTNAVNFAGLPAAVVPLKGRLHRFLGNPTPFVTPYAVRETDREMEMCVAPRLVSYYEVEILEEKDDDGMPKRPTTTAPPCLAVGLSTTKFRPNIGGVGRMPGWDANSYGFHSDDGGFFHRKGVMASALSNGYGPGDIVGCGVDYTPGAHTGARIFYTLNGKLLSFVMDVAPDVDLFPTVGVDSNSPFKLNFGAVPFKYDLQNHCAASMAKAVATGHIHVPKPQQNCFPRRQSWKEAMRSPPVRSFQVRKQDNVKVAAAQ